MRWLTPGGDRWRLHPPGTRVVPQNVHSVVRASEERADVTGCRHNRTDITVYPSASSLSGPRLWGLWLFGDTGYYYSTESGPEPGCRVLELTQ